MIIVKSWLLLLIVALCAAVGAAIGSMLRRRQDRRLHDLEQTSALKSWENEGGTLAPTPAAPVLT
jgi:hypothetical protein